MNNTQRKEAEQHLGLSITSDEAKTISIGIEGLGFEQGQEAIEHDVDEVEQLLVGLNQAADQTLQSIRSFHEKLTQSRDQE